MKVYGPYTRKDGRQHVIVVDNGRRQTISYPKWILIQNGFVFEDDDTVDHIDGDHTNNNINNLQIISRSQNASKKYTDHPELKAEVVELICSHCDKMFIRYKRDYEYLLRKNKNKEYYFCSRSCQGKVFH